MTALFIRRLNGLCGEAQKCQRREDDYERYRSLLPSPKRKHSSASSQRSLDPEACFSTSCETRRDKSKGGGVWGKQALYIHLIHSLHACWLLTFCWQRICLSRTDNAQPASSLPLDHQNNLGYETWWKQHRSIFRSFKEKNIIPLRNRNNKTFRTRQSCLQTLMMREAIKFLFC